MDGDGRINSYTKTGSVAVLTNISFPLFSQHLGPFYVAVVKHLILGFLQKGSTLDNFIDLISGDNLLATSQDGTQHHDESVLKEVITE